MLKCDHEAAQSQVYAELVANRLAIFLGIPVLVGVPARASASDARLRFARGIASYLIFLAETTGLVPPERCAATRKCRSAKTPTST